MYFIPICYVNTPSVKCMTMLVGLFIEIYVLDNITGILVHYCLLNIQLNLFPRNSKNFSPVFEYLKNMHARP